MLKTDRLSHEKNRNYEPKHLQFSVIVATRDRVDSLAKLLGDWKAQTAAPSEIIVVDASEGNDTAELCRNYGGLVQYIRVHEPSSAKQRNLGAERANGGWLVFCDDDVRFAPQLASETLKFVEENPDVAALSPQMRGGSIKRPSAFVKAYYRLQSGYDHACYGGRLFGPAISCYPCRELQKGPVECNWLPSTFLWMRTDIFRAHQFPDFTGYSFGEDIYLTHQVWRSVTPAEKLVFLESPEFDHTSIQSGIKANRFKLAQMAIRNQRRIAKEVMHLADGEIWLKSLLHRLFVTLSLLRSRRPGWGLEILGHWAA